MIYGLEESTFLLAFGIPVLIVIVLLAWAKIYNPGEDD